jgi:PucR family transcriptional regulator, purine catabolism regulatory protein
VEPSSFTVRDALELPVVRRGMPELLAGRDRLERVVRWAHVMELPDPRRLLRGGELVFTTGLGIGDDRGAQRRWVEAVADQDAAGIVVELGLTYRERVPPGMVDACRSRALPCLAFGRRVAFVEVTEAINSAILDRQGAVMRRADAVQERLVALVLEDRDADEVLEALAVEIGAPVVLEGSDRDLVYCATGPAEQDVTLRALDDFHRYERRGARTDGAFVVDMDDRGLAWGRLIALGIEAPLDDFQRLASERGATVIALGRVTQVHAERLRARSRGALLAELAAGAAIPDARRRAAALGFPPAPRALVPLAARSRDVRRARGGDGALPGWTELAGELRRGLEAHGFPALIGPQEAEILGLVALGRETGQGPLDAIADAFHEALVPHGLDETFVALAIGSPAEDWQEAGHGIRRARRRAASAAVAPPRRWYEATTEGVGELLFELRDSSELAVYVRDQLGPLLDDTSDRAAVLLDTLRAFVEHGGRKAAAARALHLDRASLYPRLRRLERKLDVDLDDPRTVLGLHLAIEALAVLRRTGPGLD